MKMASMLVYILTHSSLGMVCIVEGLELECSTNINVFILIGTSDKKSLFGNKLQKYRPTTTPKSV